MKRVIVEYSGLKLNPAARNIVRAFGLYLNLYIEFANGKQDGLCFQCGKTEIMLEAKENFFSIMLEAAAQNNLVHDELAKNNMIDLYHGLQQLADSSEEILSPKSLEAIVVYVTENISVYYKGISTADPKWQGLNRRWEQNYCGLRDFHIRTDKRINSTNLSETTVYKEIFEKSKTGVESIDHAIDTLLDTLPDDAEKILDIGSGPGYVNRNIPVDYQVLAMDIDEHILKDNVRPTCIGDITDIPLDDGAVDMVMACDVLEHIPKDLLPKAFEELKRVSKKYIYIQVPYGENLADSIAQCGGCGNIWHVNYHKNAFKAPDLIGVMGKGWSCSRINFTGDVSYYYNDRYNTQMLSDLGIDYKLVEGWRCPECGNESMVINRGYYELINDIGVKQHGINDTMPRYSEIGFLFCKEEYLIDWKNSDNQETFRSIPMNTMKLDFTEEIHRTETFTRHEMIPMFILSGVSSHREEDGYVFTDTEETDSPWVMFLIPGQICGAKLRGEVLAELFLSFSTLDITGKEFVVDEIHLSGGEFAETIQVDKYVLADHAVLKLYIKGGSIKLKDMECLGHGRNYIRYKSVDESYLKRIYKGLLISWFIPETGFIDFTDTYHGWTREWVSEKKENCSDVLNYANELRDKLSTVYRNAKAEQQKVSIELQQTVNTLGDRDNSIIALQTALEEKLQKERENSQSELAMLEELLRQKHEETQIIIASMEEQLRGDLIPGFAVTVLEELLHEKEDENQRQQVVIYELEQQLLERQNRMIPLLKNQVYKLLGKILRVLKRMIRKCPFMYKLLVKMGVKRGYNQIKGKLKSGERYE